MEWKQTHDPHRRCPKWMPLSYFAAEDAVAQLAETAEKAELAFRAGKRARKTPSDLRELKEAAATTRAAYVKARDAAIATAVYVIHDARGYTVMRPTTGSKSHSTHQDLEAAQAAAEALA